jgi:hypothetical protein
MDPQVSSILTSIGLAVASSVAAYAASKGLIPSADQNTIANDLVTLGSGLAAAGLAWYKARQHSQKAMIDEINTADNGVKVVSDVVQAPSVDGPLKGDKP